MSRPESPGGQSAQQEPFLAGLPGVRELRRAYHDRIAELRQRSGAVLAAGAAGVEAATATLVGDVDDEGLARALDRSESDAAELGSVVDREVVGILALESPVARDLRIVLAARDVTQIGLLCVGLAVALGRRMGPSRSDLAELHLSELLADAGAATAHLLRMSAAAWAALDPGLAAAVAEEADRARSRVRDFFAAVLELTGVPINTALDLGVTVRLYDRLIDHALEIADRTAFAASPGPPGGPVSRSGR